MSFIRLLLACTGIALQFTWRKSPFFGDALSLKCADVGKKICSEEESVYLIDSGDEGYPLSAGCGKQNEIIKNFTLSISGMRVNTISVVCCALEDDTKFEVSDTHEVSSKKFADTFVDCGDDAAVKKISLSDTGDEYVTRVDLTCVKLSV